VDCLDVVHCWVKKKRRQASTKKSNA
jgi:hypothetical protein